MVELFILLPHAVNQADLARLKKQANSAYSGSNISVTINNGIQEWTVPATGNYIIEAYGARGGWWSLQMDIMEKVPM